MDPAGAAHPTDRRTGAGLLVLMFPALGTLSVGCLLPLALLFVLVSSGIALAWGSAVLDRFTSDRDVALVALLLAFFINGVGLIFTLATRLGDWYSPARTPTAPKPALLLRRPWFGLGAILYLAYLLFVPSQTYFRPQLSLRAATVVASLVLWISLTSCYLAARLFAGAVRLCWRAARASPTAAFFVILLGLLITGGMAWTVDLAADPRWAQLSDTFDHGSRSFLPPTPEVAPALYDRTQHGALGPGGGLTAFGDPGGVLDDERRGAFESCLAELGEDIQREARQTAARFVGPADAADVVQDVLIRVCLRSQRVRELRPYFIKATSYRAREWARRAALSCPLISLPESCELRPDDDALGVHFNLAVNKAFCALDPGEQEVVTLRQFEGLEYPELARRWGITEQAARKRVSRTLQKFEGKLGEMCR